MISHYIKNFIPVTLSVFILYSTGFSQTSSGVLDPQFSQYVNDKLSFNPAYAGTNKLCATAIYRNQWMGYNGSPSTTLINVEGNILEFIGLGVSIISDEIGNFSNTGIRISGSYLTSNLLPGTISAGISLGVNTIGLNAPNWIYPDGISGQNDEAIPLNGTDVPSKGVFDASFGIYYNHDLFWIGLSFLHANGSEINLGNNARIGSPSDHLYLMAGYNMYLTQDISLHPSLLLKGTPNSSFQFDVSLIGTYRQSVIGGLQYRNNDAAIILLGYIFKTGNVSKKLVDGNLKIMYSYDVTTSRIRLSSLGSHEISVKYCLNIKETRKNTRHYNPRHH